jgi:O-antigen/teichoic acid export membrane protein
MRQGARLLTNSIWNMSSRVVTIASRFIIVPVAIGAMGLSHYGAWSIVGQIFAYSPYLEMGLRAAITRQTALCIARGEHDRLNRYVNTATAYFLTVALLVVIAGSALAWAFPLLFELEPEYHFHARLMVMITAVTLAGTIATFAQGAVVAGFQRFDIISASHVGSDLGRLILVLLLLAPLAGQGSALVLMAVAAGVTGFLGAAVRALAAWRLWAQMRLRPWELDRAALWQMLTFGINTVLFMMSVTGVTSFAAIIVGLWLSTADAAHYRVALELILAVHGIILAATVAIVPAAGKLQGERNYEALRRLLARATRYTAVVSFGGLIGLLFFSPAFLHLWVGPEYARKGSLEALPRIIDALRVLALGHTLFWLQIPGFQMLNGMGRHRFAALLAVLTGLVACGLVALFALPIEASIADVSWGLLIPLIPSWGLVLPIYCCRVVGQRVAVHMREGLLVPLVTCLPAGALAYVMDRYYRADSVALFIAQVAVFAVVLLISVWWFTIVPRDRRRALEWAAGVYGRLGKLRRGRRGA